MGVAEADWNNDGRPDLFVTDSRGQPHAAFQSKILKTGETTYLPEAAKFAKALDRKATVGWGDSFVDFANNGNLDLILANGAIPVTSLKNDTEPIQVIQGLGGGRFTNASGIIDKHGLPKIIGRGLAAADFDNNGRMGIAINTIGGPLVLLEDTGPVGHWLEVSLKGLPGRSGAHSHTPERPHARPGTPRRQQLPLLRGPESALRPRHPDHDQQAHDPLARRPGHTPDQHRRRPDHHGCATRSLTPKPNTVEHTYWTTDHQPQREGVK